MTKRFAELKAMDVEEFVNNGVVKFELSIIRAELEKCVKVRDEIQREMYKNFLQNSGGIIKMLKLHEDVAYSADEYNKLVDLYNEIVSSFQVKDDFVYVDEEKQKELLNVFSNFADDMTYFKSPSRYFVHSEVFPSKKNVLVVLTNDLMFIGESEAIAGFRLQNAFNYSVIDVRREGKSVIIKSESHYYKLTKDEESASKIVNLHEEFTYKPLSVSKKVDDDEYNDFLMKTEQYEKIERIRGKAPEIYCRVDFKTCVGKMDPHTKMDFVAQFLNTRFEVGLLKINKIQFLKGLVDDVFEYFWAFQREQDELLGDIGSEVGEIGPYKALLIENRLGMAFKFLEKRIFYNFKINTNRDLLKIIEGKLVHGEIDLRFLMVYYDFIKDDYFRECVNNAKNRLRAVVDEMVREFEGE